MDVIPLLWVISPNKAHWYFRVHSQCPELGPAARQLQGVGCSSPALCPGFRFREGSWPRKRGGTPKVISSMPLPLGQNSWRRGCLGSPPDPSERGDQGQQGGDRRMMSLSLLSPWPSTRRAAGEGKEHKERRAQPGTGGSLHPHLSPSSSCLVSGPGHPCFPLLPGHESKACLSPHSWSFRAAGWSVLCEQWRSTLGRGRRWGATLRPQLTEVSQQLCRRR